MKKLLCAVALLCFSTFAQAQAVCPGGYNFNGVCINSPQGSTLWTGLPGTGSGGQGQSIIWIPGAPVPAGGALGNFTIQMDSTNPNVNFKCTNPTDGGTNTASCTFNGMSGGSGLPSIANNTVLGNKSGATTTPSALTELPVLSLNVGGTWGAGNLTSSVAPLKQNASYTGANATSNAAGNGFTLNSRVTDTGTTYTGGGALWSLYTNLILNSSSITGGRGGASFGLNINAATANTPTNYTALASNCAMAATDATTGSSCFGGNFIANLSNGQTAQNLVGSEVDTNESVGGTAGVINGYRAGFSVAETSSSNKDAQGTLGDFGLGIVYANFNANAAGSTHGFQNGLSFGWQASYFPVSSTGTIIYANNNTTATGTGAFTVANGIDFHLGTFTGNELNFGNFTVDGSGNIVGNALNTTQIGNTTASTGAFTTLAASSTVSGTGFSTYLASPPAIGGSAAAAGSFTTLTSNGVANINANNNAASNIGTGTTTSTVTLGGTANKVSIGSPINFSTAGALSAATWTTNGLIWSGTAQTLTDTTGSGTITTESAAALPAYTIATTSAGVTITNLAEVYLPVPVAGTNVTATNLWSLDTAGGIKTGGIINATGASIGGAAVTINQNSNFTTNIGTGSTTSTVSLGGGSNQVSVNATTFTGTGILNFNVSANNATNIGTGTTTSTVTLGGGSNIVAINGTANTIAGSTSNIITGLTSINASNNAVTNIGTGTTTSAIHIGDGSGNNAIGIGNGTGVVTMVSPVTMSNATVKLTGVTTGTNADFLCLSGAGVVLLQTSACTISSRRFKENVIDFKGDALRMIDALGVASFNMKPAFNRDPNYGVRQVGLIAEDVAHVMPDCAIYENDMKTPKSYRQECVIAMLVRGEQQLMAENKLLRTRLQRVEKLNTLQASIH